MPLPRTIRIATRPSKLARWQSDWVAARLGELGLRTAIVEVTSRGDSEQGDPVASLGTTGVFTKEIQAAVLAGQADLAVHSLKDLPTAATAGLTLAAIPPREDPVDALVIRTAAGSAHAANLDSLPRGARVGTGSLRRRAQLLHLRPDLAILPIRGNVDTRLRKLDVGEYDALVLAAAGLVRLGLAQRIAERLAPPALLPAPGQGALAIECRADDAVVQKTLAALDDLPTRMAVTAERALLAALEGGCSAPIAAWGRIEGPQIVLDGVVAASDGSRVLRATASAKVPARSIELGRRVAEQLLAQGCAELISEARVLHQGGPPDGP